MRLTAITFDRYGSGETDFSALISGSHNISTMHGHGARVRQLLSAEYNINLWPADVSQGRNIVTATRK